MPLADLWGQGIGRDPDPIVAYTVTWFSKDGIPNATPFFIREDANIAFVDRWRHFRFELYREWLSESVWVVKCPSWLYDPNDETWERDDTQSSQNQLFFPSDGMPANRLSALNQSFFKEGDFKRLELPSSGPNGIPWPPRWPEFYGIQDR